MHVPLDPGAGTVVCLYNTGKVVVQGKKGAERSAAEALFGAAAEPPLSDVFILILRRLELRPVILCNLVPDGNTIIEALIEHSAARCAIVLLTPDDEGHPAGAPEKKQPRARQNVVLEMGMFLAKLGRKKVIILHKGQIELPSDINGLIYLPYESDVHEVKDKLASALKKMGFDIDIDIEKLAAE